MAYNEIEGTGMTATELENLGYSDAEILQLNPSAFDVPTTYPASTYFDSGGGENSDSGSGSVLAGILQSVTSLGNTAIRTLGPQNSGIPTNQGYFGGLLGTKTLQPSSSGMTLLLLAGLALVGVILFRKL